jgi:dipeptidyl aminopeptidase/acylaminoacyl peptidase
MLASLLALALAAAPAAAAARPFTPDDLIRLPRVDAPSLSPDGKLVAFTVGRATDDLQKIESALWVVPTTAGAQPRRLTDAKERVSSPRFSPDGKRIAFVSNRGGTSQAWVIPAEGGEARAATSMPSEVNDAFWAPGGTALLVTSDVDPACGADPACHERKEAELAARGSGRIATRLLFRHWSEWRERRRSHLLHVPLDGGEVLDLTPGDRDVPPFQRGDAGDLAASADGEGVYFVTITDAMEATSTNGDLFLAALDGGEPARITSNPAWDGTPRPSPDGRRLAWRAQARPGYEADQFRIMVGAPDGTNARDVTSGSGLSVDEFFWASSDRIVFLADERGLRNVHEVDVETARVRRVIEGANLHGLSASRDGKIAAALVDSFSRPNEVAVLENGKVRVLTRFADEAMAGFALGRVKPAETKSKDGFTVPGWIMTPPPGGDVEKRPGLLLVHGGPQGAWRDAWSFRWNPLVYAARGWAVIMPNPRGSTGWGEPWKDAVRFNWGGGPYDDIMAFTDAAVASGTADGSRLCAAGASYGGYMVNFMNGQTNRFRCFVTHAGDFNLEAAYYDTEELWFPEWELGLPWERPDVYRTWSPHTYVAAWKTPTLVTHGELDYRVNVAHAYSAFTALQRRGIHSKLLVFPDEGHWVLKPRNAKLFYDVVLEWIGDHLNAPPPATPRAESR